MRDLTHIFNERQECAKTLLSGLGHSEWIATEHRASLFVCFIREEVTQGLDGINTEFLEVSYNNAC